MAKSVLNKKYIQNKKAFTLVEVLVALLIFSLVIVIGLSTLLVSNASSKKAMAIKTAVDNTQYSMEIFSRTARLGSSYTCLEKNQSTVLMDPSKGVDCNLGGSVSGRGVAFFMLDPSTNKTDFYAYYLENSGGRGRIMRCVERNVIPMGVPPTVIPFNLFPGGSCASISANEINILDFRTVIFGTDPTDNKQPSIKVIVNAEIQTADDTTPFQVQTFISQRQYE